MTGPEPLDSDRVNFLVWRYLLESNYRETAAKFQKEWHVREPHRHFPWAPHVKGQALVSVINRGLIYHALERDCARAQTPPGESPNEEEEYGIFGPLSAQKEPVIEDIPSLEPEDTESRKRAQHDFSLTNGQAAKRPRLSNGYENGLGTATDTTPMDVDQNDQDPSHDNHAYPSPLEGEQEPSPIARTDGPEQGTQIDKVEELAPETTFIELSDDLSEAQSPTMTGPGTGSGGVENPPILLQCEWNPVNPSLLAGAGTDALGRVWTVSRPTGATPSLGHVSGSHVMLVSPERPKSTTVTALAWANDGGTIAVATDQVDPCITIWTVDGGHVQDINVTDGPILKLSWNQSNQGLLAVSGDQSGALITVHCPLTGTSVSHYLSYPPGFNYNLDAAWTTDADILVCGGNILVELHYSEDALLPGRNFTTTEDDSFVHVLFDKHSQLAATSSTKGNLDLWDSSGSRRTIPAHRGPITTMAWQPLPSIQSTDGERLIATGGEDCAILIWNVRGPESKSKCFLTMDSPIIRLAFTPDGAFIAGATSSQVLIWKVGSSGMPRASWSRPADPGWLSPRSASESEEEDECCLGWDASGQKLAYGSNSKLAVINFSG